jgi:YidC/Oxa1 family membrane protein insertase
MDRNSLIGFGLLVLLAIGYVSYNQYSQTKYQEQLKADSVAYAKAHPKPKVDSAKIVKAQLAAADTVIDSARMAMPPAYRGKASDVALSNKDIEISFSTKGAHPTEAWLKSYLTHNKKPLYLFSGNGNSLSALLPGNNNTTSTADLFYTATPGNAPNGDNTLDFVADLGNGKAVHFTYSLPKEGYMMSCKMTLTGMPAVSVPMTWQTSALNTEKDIQPQQTNSQVYYRFTDKDHDYFSFINKQKEDLTKPVQWVGFRLQYFSTALIAEKEFSRVTVAGNAKLDDANYVAVNKNTFDVALNNSNEQTANFNWYIGPNKYSILKTYGNDLEDMVPLGYGLMSFVKYVNKWLIIPIFNVLSGFISNYGIIIILMTLFIRLILSFFTYKSYLSAAKMRVLKPELDELRAKLGDDQQKFSMEQMKLYRTAGVNPLGGCLPTLFQLPILFAMYYFFPSSIELRQQKFLWANDLSTYDSLISWGGNIPVISSIFGNHISLFTILMTASSLFLALYNRNMTVQDPNNPMLKWMPYIFPFLLFGVFNKMAAALTFYYFCSNMISIAQQFVIQKYIIDEKAIHAQMQENKNKPAAPSKWAAKIEELQKAQQERAKQLPRKK